MTDTTPNQGEWVASKIKGDIKYVLDVGMDQGTSTLFWLKRFPNAKVISIDVHTTGVERVKSYKKLTEGRWEFIQGDSQLVIDDIPTIFDLIYIDTAHDRLTTFRELVAAWSKLRPGGVLAGHDYHYQCDKSCRPNWPSDVKGAVDTFCKYMNVPYETDVVDDPNTGVFAIYKKYDKDKETAPPRVYTYATPNAPGSYPVSPF
jgi:predicted O-methyltransferase YrrM